MLGWWQVRPTQSHLPELTSRSKYGDVNWVFVPPHWLWQRVRELSWHRWQRHWVWMRLPHGFNCLFWVTSASLSVALVPRLPVQELSPKVITSMNTHWWNGFCFSQLCWLTGVIFLQEARKHAFHPSFGERLTVINSMHDDCVKAVVHVRGLSVNLLPGNNRSWAFIYGDPIRRITNQFIPQRRKYMQF